MIKELTIEEFEPKVTKGGKNYGRFKTGEGWMSCFGKKTIETLKERVGAMARVEIIKKGDFTNINRVIEEEDESENKKEIVKNVGDKFPTSMKVAYAKDIFCAMTTRISQATFDDMNSKERLGLMDLSLEAVDKAIKHFE